MTNRLLYLGSLILLMLITGVFWGTWFTLTRSIESFSSEEFIHIGKVIIANVAVPMRIIMPLGIILLLVSLWVYPIKKSYGYYFGLLSFLMIIITLLITLIVLVPIDNEINMWTASYLPADWEAIRDKWKIYHALRTITSVLSFSFFCIFILAIPVYRRMSN